MKKRDCEHCANHKPDGCSSWECEFRAAGADLISRQDAIAAAEKESNKDGAYGYMDTKSIIDMLEDIPSAEPTTEYPSDVISRSKAEDKLKRVVVEMEGIFADIREKNCDDSVCGLCEYDADHGLDGFANECPGFEKDDCFKLNEKYRKEWLDIEY